MSRVILCVDDERIVLQSLKEQLRRGLQNVRVETAESGEEALEVFDELRAAGDDVPLVISDQLMPGMRGEELLALIHERAPETLNILLTGQATADAVGEAVNKAKLYRYIGKPWAEEDLNLTVREALRAWSQAVEIRAKEEELKASHESSLRFVPREFLSILGRERLTEVSFGDHVEREMSILFSDMRGYTSLVEGKTTAEAFAFVNAYVQLAEKPIRENGGFISNIEGDAILALFPREPTCAVRAAVETFALLRALNDAREARGERAVGMGIGVNSGKLLLGTVGGEERLQCDVVGDPVNLASRVESLTKLYRTNLLISHYAREQIGDEFELREVDLVQVKGKRTPVRLYEVLDALDEEARELRRAQADEFAAALALYRAAKIGAAHDAFAALAPDPASALFRERCMQLLSAGGAPAGFEGITTLHRK